MRRVAESKGRDGRVYLIGIAPNGSVWTRVTLSTGRRGYWSQLHEARYAG